MQIEFLNANGSVWVVKRKFKADSWIVQGIFSNKISAQELCEFYHCEKLLRGPDDTHFLVIEVPEAEIVND
ncbi:MAG: hypothetical protein RLZZ196_2785 [Bacteroidota bacterium]|jgi:hypothetical protein